MGELNDAPAAINHPVFVRLEQGFGLAVLQPGNHISLQGSHSQNIGRDETLKRNLYYEGIYVYIYSLSIYLYRIEFSIVLLFK